MNKNYWYDKPRSSWYDKLRSYWYEKTRSSWYNKPRSNLYDKPRKYWNSPSPRLDKFNKICQHLIREILQRRFEHAPYIQLIELKRWKTFISWIPIKNKLQKTWRTLQTIPQTWLLYSLLMDGHELVQEAKGNVALLIREQKIPEKMTQEMSIAMMWIIVWIAVYYWLSKQGDAHVYKEMLINPGIWWKQEV